MKITCFVVSVLILTMALSVQSQLRIGFYSSSCPEAEAIVNSTVNTHFDIDPTIAAGLLKLHYSDCLVQGCDGSVLISGSSTERTAWQNLGLRGFEVIEDAKSQLETKCPGVVSCADILALAARDAVVLSAGPSWSVPTGRRDGIVSLASEASNLPSPRDTVTVLKEKFAAKGLSNHDLVTLLGAHTIGKTECRFLEYRLYNFTAPGTTDPKISPSFLSQLKALCPQNGDGTKRVTLNKDGQTKFDNVNSFFDNLRDGYGVLESDARFWNDSDARGVMLGHSNSGSSFRNSVFNYYFANTMIRMSSIEVKTGDVGEIRKVCSMTN